MAGGPIVVGPPHALNPLSGDARYLSPEFLGLIVFFIDGDPQVFLVESKPTVSFGGGEQFPGVPDRALFEVIPEREIAIHLKEGAVTGCLAYFLDIQCPDALLDTRSTGVGSWHNTGQVGDEGNHPRDREHKSGVIAHKGGRGHHRMASITKKCQPALLNIGGFHGETSPAALLAVGVFNALGKGFERGS